MTREEILAMTPGPAMDAAVAELVFEAQRIWCDRRYPYAGEYHEWSQTSADSKEACKHTPIAYWSNITTDNGDGYEVGSFTPSTCIKCAWRVIDHVRDCQIRFERDENWGVSIKPNGSDFGISHQADEETICEAICKAVLLWKAERFSSHGEFIKAVMTAETTGVIDERLVPSEPESIHVKFTEHQIVFSTFDQGNEIDRSKSPFVRLDGGDQK